MTKIGVRNLWFQAHKWIGLILAIAIIPISITGSALVWHDALDRVLNPARFAVSGDALLAPDAYAAAARGVLKPGERIAQLTMPEHGGPITVAAARPAQAGPGRPVRTMIYLDPPTARVLDVSASDRGAIRFMHVLHGSLFVPGVGRRIVGWIGVAMMVSAFAGLWLWWPTVGKWMRCLRWRRHRNLDTNLHHQLGFWIALPLFVLSLTGAWISFPQFFAGLTGGAAAPRGGGGDRLAAMRARPIETPVQSLDAVVVAAAPLGSGDLRGIAWPTDRKAEWTVSFVGGESRPWPVTVADADGVAEQGEAPGGGQGGTAGLMRRIHDGTGMGIVWQVIIFAGGILPAILAVTGLIMWWRARGWKRDIRQRRRAKLAAAE